MTLRWQSKRMRDTVTLTHQRNRKNGIRIRTQLQRVGRAVSSTPLLNMCESARAVLSTAMIIAATAKNVEKARLTPTI